ncbi:helix-turn-helix domain-containing protein [Streptomyces barkulensis]|uniref:helix-turn-helix domain-containing protein n=1 Tax=Streptomyces barkulensis TaxID=1257026 RepID=UPI0034DFA0E7
MPRSTDAHIGARIAEQRKPARLTQRAPAARAHVPHSPPSKIESGRRPASPALAAACARAERKGGPSARRHEGVIPPSDPYGLPARGARFARLCGGGLGGGHRAHAGPAAVPGTDGLAGASPGGPPSSPEGSDRWSGRGTGTGSARGSAAVRSTRGRGRDAPGARPATRGRRPSSRRRCRRR